MTQIFLSHSHADLACAEQVRRDLDAAGYIVWKDSQSIPPGSPSYPRVIEAGIRGSAGIVVVWSAQAAPSEWVEREILYAQRLKKAIYPVMIDGTELPITLVNVQGLKSRAGCRGVVPLLLTYLPAPDSQDGLVVLLGQLSHAHIAVRKAGIDRAAQMLQRGEHRQEVLALLEELAQKDLMRGVQEKAQAVREAEARRGENPPRPAVSPDESRHIIGARCRNGHVSYFDKRQICPPSSTFPRTILRRGGVDLDKMSLECQECGEELVVRVDCEGYK
ncbi:MAG: toll/interleukin-1 receptor domain-containing protein [Chloroflexi bacterium]|nr:toll/interleukin-1 receptor domain-containing protein [Chloroflexota bacterium]